MADLSLNFDDITFNLKEISESRILSQYSQSPLYKLLLGAITSEIQELSTAITDLIKYRTIANAEGKNLDTIGRIVGINRQNYNYDADYWYQPDDAGVCPDNGHWWVQKSQQAIIENMDDITYRKWIWMKILTNHNLFSSKPEIEREILEGIAETVGIQRTGMIEQDLYVTTSISSTNKNLLTYNTNTTLTENDYLFSYPATTEIGSVIEES